MRRFSSSSKFTRAMQQAICSSKLPTPDLNSQRLVQMFENKYRRKGPIQKPRFVGREAEFPIVYKDGSIGDAKLILQTISQLPGYKSDFETALEGKKLLGSVENEEEGLTFSLEVGKGTIEMITGPCRTLHDLQRVNENGMRVIVNAASVHDMNILGIGMQPKASLFHANIMIERPRYQNLLRSAGFNFKSFALTASDQLHVDASLDELIDLTNICNLLTPLVISLCANSSIFHGQAQGVCCGRETIMDKIAPETGRHGIPSYPIMDLQDWIQQINSFPQFLMGDGSVMNDNSFLFDPSLSFTSLHHKKTNDEELWREFSIHEHYIWHACRPRVRQSTVELRAACQQPWDEHMASATLHLGMVESWNNIEQYIQEKLKENNMSFIDFWHEMFRFSKHTVKYGLATDTKIMNGSMYWIDYIHDILKICEDGLKSRELLEENMLKPIWNRLEQRKNPAQIASQVFNSGGIDALINLRAIKFDN